MLTKELRSLVEKREFISVATCDLKGRPNAAPKFILKAATNRIYLVDHIIGTTFKNIRMNPRVSLSCVDTNTLRGFQLNGTVRIIERGKIYEALRREMIEKEIRLTAQHIIEDVRGAASRGRASHERFEVEMAERFVILEVAVQEVVEIGIRGDVKRRRTPRGGSPVRGGRYYV